MPKNYGSPTGVEAPKNQGRRTAQPGSAKSYLQSMVEAHNAYHGRSAAPKQQAPTQRPPPDRGGTQMGRDILGIGKGKVRRNVQEAEE
jgi:hypothetical protein